MVASVSWLQSLGAYLQPRLLAIFFLGISSGFPLTLILSTLSYWLAKEGVSKGEIGLFASLLAPYALKFRSWPGWSASAGPGCWPRRPRWWRR